MEAYKHDLDVLFADIKLNQEELLSNEEVTQEYKDLILFWDKLEVEEDYEYFMSEMMKNGARLFNPATVLMLTCSLTFQGKFELLESFKRMANLYWELKKP